jgi:hypothetical protein
MFGMTPRLGLGSGHLFFFNMNVGCGRAAVGLTRAFMTDAVKPLYGTVPSHSSYIFLRSNEPPSAFPVKLSTRIHREMLLRTVKLGAIVNFAWTGEPSNLPKGETSATVFSSRGGRMEIPRITLEGINDVEARVKAHIEKEAIEDGTDQQVNLYICTHGARDCRCGVHGGEFARALREETERRNLQHQVKICEVGHVGGHKYASFKCPQLSLNGLLSMSLQICRKFTCISSWRMVSTLQLWVLLFQWLNDVFSNV